MMEQTPCRGGNAKGSPGRLLGPLYLGVPRLLGANPRRGDFEGVQGKCRRLSSGAQQETSYPNPLLPPRAAPWGCSRKRILGSPLAPADKHETAVADDRGLGQECPEWTPPVAFHCRGAARGACLNAWTWALWMFSYTLGADPKGEGLKESLGIV